jgi:hypothetical protein
VELDGNLTALASVRVPMFDSLLLGIGQSVAVSHQTEARPIATCDTNSVHTGRAFDEYRR